MTRKKKSDAELELMDPVNRGALERMRKMRERRKLGVDVDGRPAGTERLNFVPTALPPADVNPASIGRDTVGAPDTPADQLRAREEQIYEEVKAALVACKMWNEVGCHGLTTTYAKTTAAIELIGPLFLQAHVMASQRSAHKQLGLDRLPADKVRSAQSRFGNGNW